MAYTTLNTAVVAPMPSAKERIVVKLKPGFLNNWRRLKRRSCSKVMEVCPSDGWTIAKRFSHQFLTRKARLFSRGQRATVRSEEFELCGLAASCAFAKKAPRLCGRGGRIQLRGFLLLDSRRRGEGIRERLRVRGSHSGYVIPSFMRRQARIGAEGKHQCGVRHVNVVPEGADERARSDPTHLCWSVLVGAACFLNRCGHVVFRSHRDDVIDRTRRQRIDVRRRLSQRNSGFLVGDRPQA